MKLRIITFVTAKLFSAQSARFAFVLLSGVGLRLSTYKRLIFSRTQEKWCQHVANVCCCERRKATKVDSRRPKNV